MNGVLSHGEIVMLAALIEGCRRQASVTWLVNGDGGRIMSGTLRHLTDVSGGGAYARPEENIMEQFVHITATFEYWLSVPDVMKLMRDQVFVIDGMEVFF